VLILRLLTPVSLVTFTHFFTDIPPPLHWRVLGSSSLLLYLFTGTNLCGTPFADRNTMLLEIEISNL